MSARDAILVVATSSPLDSRHSSILSNRPMRSGPTASRARMTITVIVNVHPDDSLRVEPTDATTRASMTAAMPVEGQITLSPKMGSAGQCTGAFPFKGCDIREHSALNVPSHCSGKVSRASGCKVRGVREGIVSLIAMCAYSRCHTAPRYPPPPPLPLACITMTTHNT